MTEAAGRIVIAVLTYKRPDDLAAALPMLLAQIDEVDPSIGVLVIDNDATSSGEAVATGTGDDRVSYVMEPRPGIAAARNRALSESADRDVLIFIDDDERPQPGWLAALLDTYRATGSAAVAGAVISEFTGQLDPWIAAGRFFDRVRHPTGTRIQVAATNNLLLDLNQTRSFGLEFDERFGASGGSDTLFTRGIVSNGATMTWCDEAVVVDQVPASRMTRRWVLQRALRSGNSWSRTTMELASGRRAAWIARARLTGRGLSRIGGGVAQFVAGTLRRQTYHQARGLRTIARGAGMVSGAYGHVYVEYRRPTTT